MASYNPDAYEIVRHTDKAGNWIYRVVGGWGRDSWRVNSGISKVVYSRAEDKYKVYGGSGSVYTLCGDPRMTMAVLVGYNYIEGVCKELGLELEAVDWDDVKAAGIEWGDVE